MEKFWDENYSNENYVYGEEPNVFFKEQIMKLQVGKVLLPAEGEGRNAVFAAKLGWSVTAFDISNVGKRKALQLAKANNVEIDYKVGEIDQLHLNRFFFDSISLIFAHVPTSIKDSFYRDIQQFLVLGGVVIFEAFSKKHINYNSVNKNVGGPQNVEMLFSKEELMDYFRNFEIIEFYEKEIELNEGIYHNGIGHVIRFVGKKLHNTYF